MWSVKVRRFSLALRVTLLKMKWTTQWPEPPRDYEERDNWRIYILLAEGMEWTPWEHWVQVWLKKYNYEGLPYVAHEWLRLACVMKDPARSAH
jgi:hypothetical protein